MIENNDYKNTLRLFATGVCILTWQDKTKIDGITINAFSALSLNPPLILFCIDNNARHLAPLKQQKQLNLHILEQSQSALAYQFAGQMRDGLETHFIKQNEQLLLKGALANCLLEPQKHHIEGDHHIFIARLKKSELQEGTPLIYYKSTMHHDHGIN